MNLFISENQSKQALVTEFLSNVLQNQKLANAYCFLGDAKKDKQEIAIEFTQILNCQKNIERKEYHAACGACINCKWIASATHPMTPVYLIPKEDSKKQIISVESVKELQKELSKASEFYRVVIVPEANYMTLSKHSANALLKVIEEPNSKILFILFAEDAQMVLPTIISRSQQIQFKSNSLQEYSELAKNLFDEYQNQIYLDSRLSAMSMAEALGAEDQKILFEFLEIVQDKLANLLDGSRGAESGIAKQIEVVEDAKNNLKSFVRPKTVIEQMLVKGFVN